MGKPLPFRESGFQFLAWPWCHLECDHLYLIRSLLLRKLSFGGNLVAGSKDQKVVLAEGKFATCQSTSRCLPPEFLLSRFPIFYQTHRLEVKILKNDGIFAEIKVHFIWMLSELSSGHQKGLSRELFPSVRDPVNTNMNIFDSKMKTEYEYEYIRLKNKNRIRIYST